MRADQMVAYDNMIQSAIGVTPNTQNVLALRAAKASGHYEQVLAMVLSARAEYRAWLLDRQQAWRDRVSRRPQRGNHHDSWHAREVYARCVIDQRAFDLAGTYGLRVWNEAHCPDRCWPPNHQHKEAA